MRPLFVASIGNPGAQYAHTLHSAGHTLLGALAAHTASPPLARAPRGGGAAAASSNPALAVAFWQSPAFMNVSGPPLAAAWRAFAGRAVATDGGVTPHLVILHDELELDCGRFAVKTNAGASARGHNGLKSFLAMPNMKALEVTRVGVGIGPRPESRAPDVVADFVLRKMTGGQRRQIEGLAGDVWERLRAISMKE